MTLLGQLQALIGLLVLVVGIVLCARRTWGRSQAKRRTAAGNVFAVIDEVFSPARHSAARELRSQQQRGAVTPVPEGLPPGRRARYVVNRTNVPAPTHQTPGTKGSPPSAADSNP